METGSPSRGRRAFGIGLLLALVLSGCTAPPPVAGSAVKTARAVQAATPATPFDQASATLRKQAAALLAGDEKGWLAAVDPGQPKLRTRYRSMFRSLRGLRVSHFAYHPYQRDGSKGTRLAMGASAAFCLSVTTCPEWTGDTDSGPPRVEQSLTFRPVRGTYLITGLSKSADPNHLQPTPWESGDLVFAQGRRVTVAAPKKLAKHLKRVLAVAETAAKINDTYAAYVSNPQLRYRVYLADDRTWKSWYGGIDDKWTVAYAVPLNNAGTDVVLRTSEVLDDRQLLATTVQHEFGHVVTVGGVSTRDFGQDQWLSEGIAEYIGWAPEHARDSWRRSGVRAAMRSAKRPRTIAAAELGADPSDKAGDRFYGLAHFAMDCMAQRYGERKLFEFVRLTLRQDHTYDMASRDAFGKPFKTVDAACLSWIRKTA